MERRVINRSKLATFSRFALIEPIVKYMDTCGIVATPDYASEAVPSIGTLHQVGAARSWFPDGLNQLTKAVEARVDVTAVGPGA